MNLGTTSRIRGRVAFVCSICKLASSQLSRAIAVRALSMLVCGVLAVGSVSAGWNANEERIAGKRMWIYSPNSPIEDSPGAINGKRALIVNLHGCDQTHLQLKDHGNWEAVAEQYGAVIAIPWVENGYLEPNCWHYDGAEDSSNHARDVIALTKTLIARPTLNIDPLQVYITGLSSGAAMALQVACEAPDIYAGTGAVAGPSVGSSQGRALMPKSSLEVLDKFVPPPNVRGAINECLQLAGNKRNAFDTQIASLVYGDMDLDGPKPASGAAGQRSLVSIKWTEDNVEVLQSVYGATSLGTSNPIQDNVGTERVATVNGDAVLSLVVAYDVGHAWPSGTGESNELGGTWIAQQGLNYPAYVASWFYENNRRLDLASPGKPRVTLSATVAGNDIMISGNATDPDGSVVQIDVKLEHLSDQDLFVNVDNHLDIAFVASTGEFQDSFNDLSDGVYRVSVTVMDNDDTATSKTTEKIFLGDVSTHCEEMTSSTWNHVGEGRAVVCGSWHACAVGSGDDLGLYNIYNIVTLAETKEGFYEQGHCPLQ